MYYEIFLDVLFVKNLLVDYLLQRLVVRLLGTSAARWRSLLGSCAGTVGICLLAVIPCSRRMNTMLVYVAINTIMVRFGCKTSGIRQLAAGVFFLFGTGICLGGCMQFLLRVSGRGGMPAFFLAGLSSYLFLAAGIALLFRRKKRASCTFRVRLWMDGRWKEEQALLDTGNSLRDLQHHPVSVITGKMLAELLQEETMHQLEDFRSGMVVQDTLQKLRPCYLPFVSLGGRQELTVAVTLDLLEIEGRGMHRVIRHPVLAISWQNSSFAGNYPLILHPNLIDSQEEFL